MALSLNVPVAPSAFYSVAIEQNSYQFTFRWQTRGRCWYLSITNSDGGYLCKGTKLVPNMNLLRRNKDNSPLGSLYVVKRTQDTTQIPGRSNIGPNKDFELMYYGVEEGG